MKYEIGKVISQKYQDRRTGNSQITADNIERIYEQYPRIKELDQLLTIENANIVLLIMQDGVLRTDSIYKNELTNTRIEYLRAHGIPSDFDAPVYTCPLCNDTGFLNTNQREMCSCYHQILIPLLLNNSNFKNITRYQFDQFNLNLFSENEDTKKYQLAISPRKQLEGIRKAGKYFVEHFDEESTKNLFLLGKPGTGKTFLSGCIANELLQRGKSVLYLSSPELFEIITEFRMLSNSFSPDPVRYEKASQTYQSILNCDLFILDDLGTETLHANRQPELLSILNFRIDSGKKMIVSTNVDNTSLLTLYDERVLSRIYGNFSVLKFIGDDLRHKIR